MHVTVDPAELTDAQRHKMTIGTIVPRPIAWTSTVDEHGTVNLAPFSYFMGCHSYLPALAVSVGSRKDIPGQPKDTGANIRATGEFVVNIVDEALAEQMNISAAAFPKSHSEATAAGVEMSASTRVRPPRVARSPISIECRMLHALTLGDEPLASSLFVGRIVMWHVREDLIDDDYRVDQASIRPIARMGGPNYVLARDPWQMKIPDWRSFAPDESVTPDDVKTDPASG